MREKRVIHVGCGKTGTTSLQNLVFARHPGIRNIGRPYQDESTRQFSRAITHDDDFEHSPKLGIPENGLVVFSDESFSAAPMPGLTANRLREVFGNATVLLTVRSQLTAWPSYYAGHGRMLKHVPEPWQNRHVTFDAWFAHAAAQQAFVRRYDYTHLMRAFRTAFDDVVVLLYEEMKFAPSDFCRRLGATLGLPPDELGDLLREPPLKSRPSAGKIRYQAIRSHLLPRGELLRYVPFKSRIRRSAMRMLERTPPVDITLSRHQSDTIHTLYAESNRRLADEFDLPLSDYGYPT